MRKVITLLACFMLALQVQAQDANLLNSIKATNGRIKTFEADLVNTMIKPKKTTSQEGKLYFVAPKEFAALFTTGKYMIVNENRIKMDIGMFSGTYRLRDGGMMQSLSNIFLYGFQGLVQQLADENNYTPAIKTEGDCYVVTCTYNKKKLIGIGYKQVIFKYYTDNLLLKEIVLCDYSGNVDVYTISNVKYDVAVDSKRFEF